MASLPKKSDTDTTYERRRGINFETVIENANKSRRDVSNARYFEKWSRKRRRSGKGRAAFIFLEMYARLIGPYHFLP